jgi:ABC-type phosphate/phosphonate transport system ATPase subunit
LAVDLERCRREHGMCLVQVAHDLALARAHATHIALVDAGRVVCGTAAVMLGSPALQVVSAEGNA